MPVKLFPPGILQERVTANVINPGTSGSPHARLSELSIYRTNSTDYQVFRPPSALFKRSASLLVHNGKLINVHHKIALGISDVHIQPVADSRRGTVLYLFTVYKPVRTLFLTTFVVVYQIKVFDEALIVQFHTSKVQRMIGPLVAIVINGDGNSLSGLQCSLYFCVKDFLCDIIPVAYQ